MIMAIIDIQITSWFILAFCCVLFCYSMCRIAKDFIALGRIVLHTAIRACLFLDGHMRYLLRYDEPLSS